MKKLFRSLMLVVLGICIALSVAACGKADFSYGEDYETYGIGLDRYEELVLTPVEGSADGITIESADTSIVSVDGNRLIANAVGKTTITAKRNGSKKTLSVQVYDTGARLRLGSDSQFVYTGMVSDPGFHVVYNKQNYAYGEVYELTVPDKYADYVEVVDGKLRGKEGAEGKKVKVEAKISDYKGETVKGTFDFTVKPASFVELAAEEIEVYNAEDSFKAKATIEPTVHYNARKLEDAEVTYEVIDGADNVTVDADGNVTAKATGSAQIKVTYAADSSVSSVVNVIIHPNYVESGFVTGTNYMLDENVPEDVKSKAGAPDEIYAYEILANHDVWSSRLSFNEGGKSVVTNARSGYKYFAYDLYFDGDSMYVGLDHADCQYVGVGQYFRSDYMKIVDLETGRITNRLERNKWIRIVYDLYYYVENTSYVAFSETGIFYAQSGSQGTKSYIGNVCWFLDDNYGENVHAPEDADYVLDNDVQYKLNADGTISATNNEWTFDDTVNKYNGEFVESESTYAPYDGEVAGVTGAWKFAPVDVTRPNKDDASKTQNVFGQWENQLKLVSATAYKNGPTGDTGYNVNGMYNLTEAMPTRVGAVVNDDVATKYKYLTFDIYVEQGSRVRMQLNHVVTGGWVNLGETKDGYVDGGTDLSTKSSYIRAWEKGGDKLAYYMESGKWYTVCLAYFDNYASENWSANILLAADGGSVIYLNDVRFHKSMDGVAPTEYAGYKPTSGLTMLDNTKEQGGTLAWVYDAEVEEKGEEFKGALKFTTSATTNAWDNSRLGFDQIAVGSSFFKEGKKYAVVDVYFDENVKSLGAFTWVTYTPEGLSGVKYSKSLTIGETTGMYLYENGSRVKGNVEANKWYTLVIPVDYPAKQQWAVGSVEILSKDGTAATTYFNNIRYTKDIPYECKDIVITDKPDSVAWKSMSGANTSDTKSYDISYFVTPGYDIEWSSNNEEVATVANGVVTFNRGKWNQSVTITATITISEGVTVSDSVTLTLTNEVTEFKAGSSVTLAYGDDEEADTIYVKSTGTGSTWQYTARFTDIVKANANEPVASYQAKGYKYVKMNVYFDENVKNFLMDIHLNKDGKGPRYYQDFAIGTAPASDVYFYDVESGIRVTEAITSGKWYTLYIPTDYTAAHTWAEACIGLSTKTADVAATLKIENLTYVKAITGVYDVVEITGAPSGDLIWETVRGTELTLGKNSSLDVTWSIEKVSGDDGIVTIDPATGKLTFAAKASDTEVKTGLYKVTATPTDSKYASLASSVNISIISEYDEPTTWHFAQTSNVEWQGNTGDDFAKSWKFTGGDLVIGGKASEYTGESNTVATANYITLEIYFAKASGVNYFSNMYSNGSDGKGKVAYAWLWGATTSKSVTVYQSDWKTVVNTTENYVRFYEMDGSASTKVETGKWYKLVLPKNIESNSVSWGQIRLSIDGVKNGDATEREVYYRNVSYGDTIPSGWINE